MTPTQKKSLEELKKRLDAMSDEEFTKAYEECCIEGDTSPTIAEFCKWNNIPYGDKDV